MNYFLFGLLSLFWGGSFIAIKLLIQETPPFTSAFYRVFFSLIFLFLIFSKKMKLPKNFWGMELFHSSLAGLCSIGIPFSLLFWGEKYVSPGVAGVINGTVPLWTLTTSFLFFGGIKDISFKKISGLIMGVIGILLIFGPKIKMTGNQNEAYGLTSILFMAIFYSIGINLNKKILSQNKIITQHLNIMVQQFSSLIYLGIISLIFDGIPQVSLLYSPHNYLSILYLSFFSTCIAFIIFYHLIHVFGPVKASTVTFFVPPIALLLDAIIYKSELSFYEALGSVVIISSMFLLKDPKKYNIKKILK